jgi:hypothetical protein
LVVYIITQPKTYASVTVFNGIILDCNIGAFSPEMNAIFSYMLRRTGDIFKRIANYCP